MPMRFLICGTAAAEGWPSLFCACAACAAARERGGRDRRTRSAYMVGESVRIDWGPDSYFHMQRYDLAYERLTHLLVTHSHWDHWVPEELAYRRQGFAYLPGGSCLHVYGNARVRQRAEAALGGEWEKCALVFHDLRLWEPIALPDGIVATAVEAAHAAGETCVNYVLEAGGQRILQGHDTGWWPEATWEFLKGRPLDVALLDCTFGARDGRSGHMGGASVVAARDRLAEIGALAEGARVIATHFSHNGGSLHDELEAFFTPHGIEVAYDGLAFEIPEG
jgi:phosphoribosyl 1,2-cyclic phosphate phosphodiesterase